MLGLESGCRPRSSVFFRAKPGPRAGACALRSAGPFRQRKVICALPHSDKLLDNVLCSAMASLANTYMRIDEERTERDGSRWSENATGWIRDIIRFYISIIYVNSIKQWYRVRGMRGPAPCQAPGDSGRAGETRCDACINWHRPARFRQVCPLVLVRPGQEPMCGVEAKQVRPFWQRAALAYASLCLAGYLVFSFAALGFLRARGVVMPLTVVAAPWGWRELPLAQARMFLARGKAAHAAGRWHEAAMALSVAHNLNPNDTEAGVLLVSIWQVTRPVFADPVFASLIKRAVSPEEAANYRYLWFRSLLERGDFSAVLGVATAALTAPDSRPGDARVWVDAVIFATRQTRDRSPLEALCAQADRLPLEARGVLQFELGLLRATDTAPGTDLTADFILNNAPPAELYARKHWLRRLIEHGKAEAVLRVINGPASAALPTQDKLLLELDAYAHLGWQPARREVLARLLESSPPPEIFDRIGANLIRYPDPETNTVLWSWWSERQAQTSDPESLPPPTYLVPVAGAARETAHLSRVIAAVNANRPGGSSFWQRLTDYFTEPQPSAPIANFLPYLRPLGLETTYALLQRYPDRTPKKPIVQQDRTEFIKATVEESDFK